MTECCAAAAAVAWQTLISSTVGQTDQGKLAWNETFWYRTTTCYEFSAVYDRVEFDWYTTVSENGLNCVIYFVEVLCCGCVVYGTIRV